MAEQSDRPHSRILSSSYPQRTPSQPWTKILMAFAMGAVLTLLVSAFAFSSRKASEPDAKLAQRAEPQKPSQPKAKEKATEQEKSSATSAASTAAKSTPPAKPAESATSPANPAPVTEASNATTAVGAEIK